MVDENNEPPQLYGEYNKNNLKQPKIKYSSEPFYYIFIFEGFSLVILVTLTNILVA